MTPVAGFMLVTTTSVAPIAEAGVVAMMHGSGTPNPQTVALYVTAIVVATVPVPTGGGGPTKLTIAPYSNPLPLITTGSPQLNEPLLGEMALKIGGAGGLA